MKAFSFRSSVLLFAVVAVLGLGGCASHSARVASLHPSDAGLVVQGSGDASAAPDLATLRVGIEARRATMADARSASAAAQARVLEAVHAHGVVPADVQTDQLTLQPDYEYGEQGRVLRGYVATNTVRVKVRDLTKVGSLVDATVSAGGDDARVDGLAFELERDETVRSEARRRAVANARAKAQDLARELGVTLGEPISVEETSAAVPGPMMMRMDAAQASAGPTPVAAGSVEAHVEVRVRWAID